MPLRHWCPSTVPLPAQPTTIPSAPLAGYPAQVGTPEGMPNWPVIAKSLGEAALTFSAAAAAAAARAQGVVAEHMDAAPARPHDKASPEQPGETERQRKGHSSAKNKDAY